MQKLGPPAQHDTTYGWAGFPSVITNGAAGAAVLVPGPVCPNNDCGAQQALMTFIANDGIASQANLPIPNFLPVLQREDGSYIGNDANNNLDAIGPDGTLLWQIPQATLGGVTPLYATADGGAIVTSTVPGCAGGDIAETLIAQFLCQLTGQSLPNPYSPQGQLGTLYTLDQYGNVVVTRDQNGNIIPPPPDTGARVSWMGSWYADAPGTISSFAFTAVDLAQSWWGMWQGNASSNGTSVLQMWYPPLKSCAVVQMVCAGDALQSALNSLRQLLAGPCTHCDYVFSHPELGGGKTTYGDFLSPGNQPYFFDGSKSNLKIKDFQKGGVFRNFGEKTVSEYMGTDTRAITKTPGPGRMITFFATEGPEATCNSLDSKLNEAAIFHEALHAKSGLQDTYFPPPDLLSVFKFNDLQDPSVKITYGIIDNVLGGGVGDHVCGN